MSKFDIPTTMPAIVLKGYGGYDQLEYREDWPVPAIKEREALIRVDACGLNNTDVNTRTAWYSKDVTSSTAGKPYENIRTQGATWGGVELKFPRIQGADVSGQVVAVGPDVRQDLIGERVLVEPWIRDWSDPANHLKVGYLGSEIDGGFAQYVAVDARQLHPVHCGLTDEELATFATAYVTAENLLDRAGVDAGDVVLVTGASGGVGSAAVQLAKRRGAKVIGMSAEEKHPQVLSYGADAMLPRNPKDLSAELKAKTGLDEVSVVADVVGGPMWPQLIGVLGRNGRYSVSGAISGSAVELDLRTLYLRDLTFTGATVVPPGTFARLVSYIERGEIRPILAKTFPLRDFVEAQKAFLDKSFVGKIVVTMST